MSAPTCEVPNCGREATRPGAGYWTPWACEEHWADFLGWQREKTRTKETR